MNRACFVCACALLICGPVWPQVTYQVDDGGIENAVGLIGGGDMWWANAFTAVPGGETINEIQIAFHDNSGLSVGDPFSVHVYDDSDDDGDPTTGTLTLLASASATVADATGETFQSVAVGPATISGGFFVAAVMTHGSGQYPAAMDETSPQGQSWLGATSTAGGMDPADPVSTSDTIAVQPVESVGFPCNWTLRAVSGMAVEADLAVTKASNAMGTLHPGDQIIYTIGVTNNGPSDATGVTVTDMLPAMVTYVSDTCGGLYDGGTHAWTWTIGALADGASATCDVVVEVAPGASGSIANTATVTGAEADPTPANDSSTVSVAASSVVPGIPALGTAGTGLLILLLGGCAMLILRRNLG